MEEKELISSIINGKIFIYPTDTIYGLGCNAYNQESVEKIKSMKLRDKDRPLSVIAPSIEWIEKNLIVDCALDKYLPGPYTILLKKKDPDFLNHVSSNEFIGVRVPDHEFTGLIKKAGVPFITTSVNLSGDPPIKKISEIDLELLGNIDHVIDVGELNARPSTLVINGKEIVR